MVRTTAEPLMRFGEFQDKRTIILDARDLEYLTLITKVSIAMSLS